MDEPLFTHPLTGELIQDEPILLLAALLDADGALRRINSDARRIREARDRIAAHLAALQPAAPLPRPSRRTRLQERIAACPRCGHHDLVADAREDERQHEAQELYGDLFDIDGEAKPQ